MISKSSFHCDMCHARYCMVRSPIKRAVMTENKKFTHDMFPRSIYSLWGVDLSQRQDLKYDTSSRSGCVWVSAIWTSSCRSHTHIQTEWRQRCRICVNVSQMFLMFCRFLTPPNCKWLRQHVYGRLLKFVSWHHLINIYYTIYQFDI